LDWTVTVIPVLPVKLEALPDPMAELQLLLE
jgi:hypothetical protein